MSVHLNSNPVKLLNHSAIKPDVGCCAKFAAFIIGSAAVGGLATAAFSGPLVKPVADAAAAAAASTAGKVAEAAGVAEGLRSLRDTAVQIGAVYGGDTIVKVSHNRYSSLGCTSMTDSPACFVSGAGIIAGGLVIVFAAYVLYRIARLHGQKYL